jgi:hypothetical protein
MENVILPETLNYPPSNFSVHTVQFDPSRCSGGLSLDFQNYRVTQTVGAATHKCVYGFEGFTTGSHYFSFKINDRGNNGYIMIGVSDGSASCATSSYPGASNCPGVSIYLSCGYRYYSNTNAAMPNCAQVTQATHIGVLLNMDMKTCSFFADGRLIGMGAGSDVLKAQKYFPVISLYELGQSVSSDVVSKRLEA